MRGRAQALVAEMAVNGALKMVSRVGPRRFTGARRCGGARNGFERNEIAAPLRGAALDCRLGRSCYFSVVPFSPRAFSTAGSISFENVRAELYRAITSPF